MDPSFRRKVLGNTDTVETIEFGAGQSIVLKAGPGVKGLRGRSVYADLSRLEAASAGGLIGAIIGGDAPLEKLPPFLREAASVRLNSVSGLLEEERLSYLTFDFALPGRHAIIPSLLEIEDVWLDLSWMRLDGVGSVSSELRAGARLQLGGAPVEISIRRLAPLPAEEEMPDLDRIDEKLVAEAETALGEDTFATLKRRYGDARKTLRAQGGHDFVVEGALAEEVEIARILERFGIPFPAGPKLAGLDFLYDTRTDLFRFDIEVKDVLSLSDGTEDGAFSLRDARLALEGTRDGLHGVLSGTIQLYNTEFTVSAASGQADDGWLLQGRLEVHPDVAEDDLSEDLDDICAHHFGAALSAGLMGRLRLRSIDITVDTGASRVSLSAAGTVALDPAMPVAASLEVTMEKRADGWRQTVGGHLAAGSGRSTQYFDLLAEHDATGGSIAAVYHSDADDPQPISQVVGSVSQTLADVIPAPPEGQQSPDDTVDRTAITARIPRALACTTWIEGDAPGRESAQMLFGLDIDGGLDLTAIHFDGLPLIGDIGSLISIEPLRLTAQVFVRSGEDKTLPDTRAGQIASAAGFAFPAAGLDQPFSLSATLQFGEEALQVGGAPDGFGKEGLPAPAQQASEAKTDPVSWVQLSKRFGPLQFERVGVSFEKGNVTAHLEASLSFAGVTLSLQDLTASAPIGALDRPSFGVGGLGLALHEGEIEIGGAFLRTTFDGAPCFAGGALVRGPTFALNLSGGFVEHEGHPSFMVYGVLDYPLGGPPFFYVTQLAAGFGVNRTVVPPTIDGVNDFSLVRAARAPDASAPETPLQVVKKFSKDLPPKTGETFLALGVGFTTFKAVDSFAVVIGRFGEEFALDLVGVSTIRNPPGASDPVVNARIGWLAQFRPEEGTLLVRAKILPGAYVFAKDCPLAGEFAFACWFRSHGQIPAGDFVATLGGYHPVFEKPAHYPEISDRLSIVWKPNANLTVKGQAYVALCPHAIMAGCRLDAVWEDGSIRAWFRASVDFVICWEPYHYDATVSISMNVTATVRAICTVTVTLDASARLHIWGPEFAGEAEVHLKVLGFSCDFNILFNPGQGRPQAIAWDAFVDAFLPRPEGNAVTEGATLAGEITCESGLWPEATDEHWIVDPASLVLTVVAAAPLGDKRVGVAPMGITPDEHYSGEVEIILEHDGKTIGYDACFEPTPIQRSVPAAVWGAARVTKDRDGRRFVSAPNVNARRLIDDVTVGYRLTPRENDSHGVAARTVEPGVQRTPIKRAGFRRDAVNLSGGRGSPVA